MLKFVSHFDDVGNDETYITYRIYAYTKQDFRYEKEETIRLYLDKLRDFLADVRQTVPACKGDDWFWYDYSRRLKKVIRHSLFDDLETVHGMMLKKNDDDFGLVSLYSFSHGDDLYNDRMYVSYRHNYKHYLNESNPNQNSLNFTFSGVWREPGQKPFYTKQDIIEIIRLIYKHYDVTHIVVADDMFNIRFPNHPDYYEGSYAVFPHRTPCAWMLGLPHKITGEDMPETAEFIPINDNNTLCISNRDDWFTSFDSEHIQKANFLEIALWQKGLLPAIY